MTHTILKTNIGPAACKNTRDRLRTCMDVVALAHGYSRFEAPWFTSFGDETYLVNVVDMPATPNLAADMKSALVIAGYADLVAL